VDEAFLEKGPEAAMQVLGASLKMSGGGQEDGEERLPGGGQGPQGEPDAETMEMMARLQKNMEFFIGYEVPPFNRYVPDIAALQASSVQIVPAMGDASEGEPPHRVAVALAERLGTKAVLFPGDHGGFGAQPEAFAGRLHEVLSR
jgi:hypothetical protein